MLVQTMFTVRPELQIFSSPWSLSLKNARSLLDYIDVRAMGLSARGSFHQGMIGRYAGNQCTIVALFALAALFLQPSNFWTGTDVDNVLRLLKCCLY